MCSSRKIERMTLLMPGQRPPQVTMAARVFAGAKNSRSREPAFSNQSSSLGGNPSVNSMTLRTYRLAGVNFAAPSPGVLVRAAAKG